MKTKRGMVLLLFMGMLLLLMSGCGAKYENPADLPFGSDGWQMQTAGEAIEALSAAGFTNIQENIKETSSADDAGKITKITVNGENLFRKGDRHEGTDVVEITYYSLKRYEAEMEIEVSEDAGLPVFTVNTNLPNGTRLELTLSNEESYSEQQTVKVKDSLQELLSISGYGDYMVQIEVLNDQNHENTLLTVLLGMVSYNCVS